MSFKRCLAAGMAAAMLAGTALSAGAVEYGEKQHPAEQRSAGQPQTGWEVSPRFATIDYYSYGIEAGYAYCQMGTQYDCSMSISMVLYKANDRGGWGRIATKTVTDRGDYLVLEHPVEEDGTRYKAEFTCIADGERITLTAYSA